MNRPQAPRMAHIQLKDEQPTLGIGFTTALTLFYHRIVNYLDSSLSAFRVMTTDFKKALVDLKYSIIPSASASFGFPSHTFSCIVSSLCERHLSVISSQRISLASSDERHTTRKCPGLRPVFLNCSQSPSPLA